MSTKQISLSKLEKLCLDGDITIDKFIKEIRSRYTEEEDADILISSIQRRLNEKDQPTEETEEIKTLFVRTVNIEKSILEAITWKNNRMFLVHNTDPNTDKHWTSAPLLKTPTARYMPIEDTPYPSYGINESIKLTEGIGKIPPLSWYYPKVYNEVNTFIAAPKEPLSLITNTILLSYEQQKYNSLGYPAFYGIPDTGKTRVGEIIAGMGYRPLMSMKLNAANVYDFIGTVNEGDCTIIDDEIQTLGDDPAKGDIYRGGYRKGAKVRRILDASSTKRTYRLYNTYCLKILLGYYPPNDSALVSRTIPTIMTIGYPEKDEIDDEDRLRFSHLKNELLLSRMVHYFDPLPRITIKLKGRIKEVWKAQLLTSYNTPAKQDIVKLVGEYVTEMEAERKGSLDAHLITVVSALHELQGGSVSFEEIWYALLCYLEEGDKLEKGSSSIQCSKLDTKVSKWVIGKKLKTVLVGKQLTEWIGTKMARTYKFDKTVLDTLQQRFKITNDDKFNCVNLRYGVAPITERAEKVWKTT